MKRTNGNSRIPEDMRAEMDRVFAGALEVIARHPKRPQAGPTEPLPARSVPGETANHAPPTIPGRARRKIGPETRFRAAKGRTRITSGSLRAKVLDFMAAGHPAVNLADLAAVLKQDARGVVGKLLEAGWLEIVS